MESIIKKRHEISVAYCQEKGWDIDDLTVEQILEIRQQPGWRDAGRQDG
jgi:hypothetical protein